MALVKMVPIRSRDENGRLLPRPRVPEPYEESAEWVQDHLGQWWWRPLFPKNRPAHQETVWYTATGKMRAYPTGECPQWKDKEPVRNVEEVQTLWYSADCTVSAQLVWENPRGKGKGKLREVKEEDMEEYWEREGQDPVDWGQWEEEPDQQYDLEAWREEQVYEENAHCSESSGRGQQPMRSAGSQCQQHSPVEATDRVHEQSNEGIHKEKLPVVWGMDPDLVRRGRAEVVVVPPSSRSLTADGRNRATVARSERRKRSKSRQRMEAEAGLVGQRELRPPQTTSLQQQLNQPQSAPVVRGLPGLDALIPVRDVGTALEPVVARLTRRRRNYALGMTECEDLMGRVRSTMSGVSILGATVDVQLAARTLQGMARDLEVVLQTVMVLEGRFARLQLTAGQDETELGRARMGVLTLTNLLGGGFPSLGTGSQQ